MTGRAFLTICLTSVCLTLGGCSPTPEPIPPVIEEALFCDVMAERFRYRQDEIDARAEQWPANLRREFALNLAFDRECDDGLAQAPEQP